MRRLLLPLSLFAVLWPVGSAAQTTRAEAIAREQAEKAKNLQPYKPKKLEKLILDAEDGKLRRMIAPHNGFFVEYGYTHKPVGSGIGFGGGFRHDLFDRQGRVVLEAGQTFRNYRMLRSDFSLPRLVGGRVEVGVEGVYRHHTQDDFYGLGEGSREDDRVSFGYTDRELQGRVILRPLQWLSVGTRLGRLSPAIRAGTDRRFPSIEDRFDASSAPGLDAQPEFGFADAFAEVDCRDEPGNARAGGHYQVSLRRYADRGLDRYGFRQLDLLLQHFIPLFDKKRVFAFQYGLVGTTPGAGHHVPFYMQPTLGGSRTLRSVDELRFRDRHATWLNAEYRWEAFSALDMALFTDWGSVAPRASELTSAELRRAYGIGFRFNTSQAVIFRADIATGGGEGVRTFFKFSKAF